VRLFGAVLEFGWRLKMKLRSFTPLFVLALFLLPASAFGQTPPSQPQVVSLCDLLKDPKAFSGTNIQIRGTIISEFEIFNIGDDSCSRSNRPGIWLMFGGDVDCPTPSTWNDVNRPKGKNVKFDGVEYSLVKDKSFSKLHNAITLRRDKKSVYRITASLEGTFFAGDTENTMPGYGHIGCCYLFIIHKISQVEVQKKPTA
jgi:hypothetical protein